MLSILLIITATVMLLILLFDLWLEKVGDRPVFSLGLLRIIVATTLLIDIGRQVVNLL